MLVICFTVFPRDLRRLRVAHILKIGEIEDFPIVRVHFIHAETQDAVSLLRPYDLLRQQPPVRLAGQRIEAEQGLPPALVAQRHVPRRLIEIRLEAAVPDAGLFGEQIGENIQHQLLGLVNVVQIAVDIQGQGSPYFFIRALSPSSSPLRYWRYKLSSQVIAFTSFLRILQM